MDVPAPQHGRTGGSCGSCWPISTDLLETLCLYVTFSEQLALLDRSCTRVVQWK